MSETTKDLDPYVTYYGGEVKSMGENRIGGRLITYSTADSPDKVRDFFDASSDLWLNGTGERRPILYRHGNDPVIKKRRFGEIQVSRGSDGLWGTGYIAGKDEDSLNLLAMAKRGALNWSTGSVGHLVEKTPVGNSYHVDSWPIAECTLSLKDLVCEPRNIVSLKDLPYDVPDFHTLVSRSPFSQSAESDEHQADLNRRADAVIQEFRDQQQDFYNKQAEQLMQEFYNAKAAYEYERLQRMIARG